MPKFDKWEIYQYKVVYEPDQEQKRIKKALLRTHSEAIGPYIFDGAILFTRDKLESVSKLYHNKLLAKLQIKVKCNSFQPMNFMSIRDQDQQTVKITISNVGELKRGDHQYIQFFNIIMRKCLEFLQLQLVGRNYFDPHNRVFIYYLNIFLNYSFFKIFFERCA